MKVNWWTEMNCEGQSHVLHTFFPCNGRLNNTDSMFFRLSASPRWLSFRLFCLYTPRLLSNFLIFFEHKEFLTPSKDAADCQQLIKFCTGYWSVTWKSKWSSMLGFHKRAVRSPWLKQWRTNIGQGREKGDAQRIKLKHKRRNVRVDH